MASLFHDKIFTMALVASATIHLAALSRAPNLPSPQQVTPDETYIEFIYYQIHSAMDESDSVTATDEANKTAVDETESITLEETSLDKEKPAQITESPARSPQRKIYVKMRERDEAARPLRYKDIYEEGRLISEYARTLDRIIANYGSISYPEQQRESFMEGSVMIQLRIGSDGSLRSIIAREDASSACPAFKAAALAAIKRASAHFPPFPEGVGRNEILFSLPVSFALE